MEEVTTNVMSEIVSQLVSGITSTTIFGVVADVMPFVITLVPICLGLYVLRRIVKGTAHGKLKF